MARVKERLLAEPEGLPEHIDQLLTCVDAVNTQFKAADRALLDIVEQDPICQRLMTVPGVGPIIALRGGDRRAGTL